MTPEQWEIHQRQQKDMFEVILLAAGADPRMRKRFIKKFEAMDTWSKK